MPLYEWLINKRLRYQYLTLLAFSILALLALYLLYRNTPKVSVNFFDFYHKNLRGYLFSGFISVGSFLLSLHTFVIINLRDKVFATQEYKEIYSIATGIPIDKINDSVLYKPLDNYPHLLIHQYYVLSQQQLHNSLWGFQLIYMHAYFAYGLQY